MGLFDQINFAAEKTADSTYDLRLLDATCDHRLRDEMVNVDITPLLTNTPYSGNGVIYDVATYSGQINPDASLTFTTVYPYVNDGSFTLSQSVETNVKAPITEEIIVPDLITTVIDLKFPPKTNSVSAKQKIVLSNDEIIFKPFTRYDLFQLFGQIEFTNSLDAGETIIFKYLADKKRINQFNQNGAPNWVFNGLNAKSQGVFTLYGRSLISTRPQLFIRYKTVLASCPKCAGKGSLSDLVFDAHGRVQLVYDFSKLIQDYFKRFYTDRGSNPFDISEGTDISKMVGIARGDGLTLENLVKSEVVNLLFTIRAKQKSQQGIQGIGLAEQIAQINNIDVRAINATDLSIRIEVLSKSGKLEQIGSTISLIGGS